ncbi:energy-coupling factor transporter transmembrane component T [Arsenicicoccus sp. oral taxon 190]|uniref:energy-coupling factor transporter transmembrane component T n=1 Tax=Arsenicicoccus sp. oral taxon 190 TaxID=1658671 RepID=UPI000AE8412C|nr:energy-coupling factor transporter transmembrane component T [Arsenicicoccus sp. oral taxon 190]
MSRPSGTWRVPRRLHPMAWWLWALGLAAAASRTDNPLVLLAIVAVAVLVVALREDPHADAPLGFFVTLGLVALALRVGLGVVLGGGVAGPTVLVTLPRVPLPEAAGSVRLGGPVSLEGILASLWQGLQLATMLVAIGAANALASPRRLLRHVPATLYDVGTAVVVALSFAPRMVVDARAVRAARRLRGHDGRGLRELSRTVVPVLEAAFDRSLDLAASMEARGYGRHALGATRRRRAAGAVTVLGLIGLVGGLYALLDGSVASAYGWPLLAAGVLLSGTTLWLGAQTDTRTRYRRDRWGWAEWAVTAAGLAPAVVLAVLAATGAAGLAMPTVPLAPPPLVPAALLAVLVAAGAGVAAPPLPASHAPGGTRTGHHPADEALGSPTDRPQAPADTPDRPRTEVAA